MDKHHQVTQFSDDGNNLQALQTLRSELAVEQWKMPFSICSPMGYPPHAVWEQQDFHNMHISLLNTAEISEFAYGCAMKISDGCV